MPRYSACLSHGMICCCSAMRITVSTGGKRHEASRTWPLSAVSCVDDMRASAGEERIGSRSTWDQCQEFFDKFEYTGARRPMAAAEQLACVAVLPGPSWCSGLTKRLSVSAVKYLKKCGIPIKEVSIHDRPRSDRLSFAVMTSMSVSSSDTAVPISQGKVPKNKKGRRLLSMLL